MDILIIDDEEIVRRTLQRYVEHRGDTPFLAANGRCGIELLQRQSIDLVITDMRMPDIDGMGVLQQVRDHHAEIPVIVVTGYADTDMAIQAVNEGAFAFLQKPILSDALNTRIDEALADLTQRRQQSAHLAGLEKTAAEQRHRLEQEQAFSAAVLHNIPFPVCLIDPQRRIHMTNEAFHCDFTRGIAPAAGKTIDALLHGLDLSAFQATRAFSPGDNGNQAPGVTIEIATPANGDESGKRHYYVTAFAVRYSEQKIHRDLICLFMQDHTLQVELEREQQLRDWCLERAYEFKAETAPMIHSAELLALITEQLAVCLGHFQPTRVELGFDNQRAAAGAPPTEGSPYIAVPIIVEGEVRGQLQLFAPDPANAAIQREFVDKLVETIARRFESREIQLHLMQTSQLRALGEMAAGVAHELNQPLSGIRTFAEGIIFGMKNNWKIDDAHIQSSLEDIVDQVDRMTTIIDHMRTFSRDSSEEAPSAFHIDEVFANVFKLVHAQLKVHGVEVVVDIDAGLPACRGWPQQLEQVLLNLITNARQAMHERAGKLREGQAIDADWSPRLELAAHLDAGRNQLVITIADTGGGISEHIIENIFEPFFTSKEVGQGTGLGLSISHGIVQKHGGHIALDNQPGTGATFSVCLPIAQDSNDQ
ncbi:MAG: response regulator [Candidatus Latescibacteria bacterium]|jgi:signal transduction histidine kinase/FixJ family two-component response regulator|nr:response regulator [Candidatus Latescibacterota bacterium]